jgi:hypothetical protein
LNGIRLCATVSAHVIDALQLRHWPGPFES